MDLWREDMLHGMLRSRWAAPEIADLCHRLTVEADGLAWGAAPRQPASLAQPARYREDSRSWLESPIPLSDYCRLWRVGSATAVPHATRAPSVRPPNSSGAEMERRMQAMLRGAASAVSLARGVGPRLLAQTLARRVWGSQDYFGLRSDLSALPPPRRAKLEITMEPRDCPAFDGFADELALVKGPNHLQVVFLRQMCDAGVKTLHVATGPDGSAAYCQWLISVADQERLHAHLPGRLPMLGPNDVLLEGAYTFARFRGLGLMAEGMWQLLEMARNNGAEAAITYVRTDSVPALRGCAHVGFVPDHVRHNVRRLGRTRSIVRPVDGEVRRLWAAATAPKSRG